MVAGIDQGGVVAPQFQRRHPGRQHLAGDGVDILAPEIQFQIGQPETLRAKIARLEVRLQALQMANYRALAGAELGRAPGPESSILKLVGSMLVQEADELCMEIMGQSSLAWHDDEAVEPFERWVPPTFCYDRATTIYAGSNEIQKNILAKLILGLPSA